LPALVFVSGFTIRPSVAAEVQTREII
jgi:hypothetical protein